MSNNKEAERAELHKTIWRIANDLRGSVDGWDFKTYVLGMLFYRFISENLTSYLNEQERKAGTPDFDYARLSDADAEFGRAETVKEKGFYILPSELFANVRAGARHDANLNETLSRIFADVEGSATGSDSEDDFKGLFDDLDVNSSKLGPTVAKRNEKLVKLLDAIGDLPLSSASGSFSDNTIDLFGDAYEYLMQMYASTAGKSGGEFYTPQEVSELLARITVVGKTEVNKVYDPACGSGSLLLKFVKVLGHDKVRQGFFGQEINLTTYNLCRINMFLHDVNYEKFDIAHGDTLTDPAHWDDEPFEAIVSNPPYSIKWDPYGLHFAFLDPFDLGALNFDIIVALSRLTRIDILVHISQMDLQRNAVSYATTEESVFDTFAPGWREKVAVAQAQQTLRQQVFQYWRDKVADLGVWPSTDMRLLTGGNNQPLYWLLMAAKHPLPHKFWATASNVEGQGKFNF